MKAWCEQCGKYVDYSREVAHSEALEINGTRFNVSQTYGICPVCGDEVLSNTLADINVHKAHNAYRRTLGSITAEEIQGILDMYHIGAQPLSLLLGWGANTIERQMKHTIPSREHAKQLRVLEKPTAMFKLLQDNRDRITEVAYKKAMAAVYSCLEFDVRTDSNNVSLKEALNNIDPAALTRLFQLSVALNQMKLIQYSDECKQLRQQYQLAFSGR